ncbi:MAG: SprB repeat-containing protein [Ferruginibacter sp.]|nr:SprB repeat-containing protein [Ferruginibacter sp.]
MKKIIIFLITCMLINTSHAQQVWYFGQGAGIKFNNNPTLLPSAFGTSGTNPIRTYEGCALVHDNTGNVIISTDGKTVFNKNNVVMPNGTGLFGHESATQSAIIVPVPDCCDGKKYFIFTLGSWSAGETEANANGFYYSIVDLTLDGGLGEVIAKNIPLVTPTVIEPARRGFTTEKLTATQDGNGGYWVLAHGNTTATRSSNGKRFYALHITPQSIGTCLNPSVDTSSTSGNFVTTDIGTVYGKVATPVNNGLVGQMKFSPTGSKVALAERTSGGIALFDFNLTTGVLSNNRSLMFPSPYNSYNYGIEFSSNEKYIYSTYTELINNNIYQTEVANFDLPHSVVIGTEPNFAGSLQLAKDGNIYVANKSFGNQIGVITNANLASANYAANSIILPQGTYSHFSLPTMLHHTYCTPCDTSSTTLITTKTDAISGQNNGTVNIFVTGGSAPYTHNWSNGATTSTLSGLAVGNYSDTITDRNGCVKIEEVQIVLSPCSSCSIQATFTKPNNGGNVTLTTTNTALECGKGYDFNPATLTCIPVNSAMVIKEVKVIDGSGNTPTWASSFTGTGMLNIPANTTGLFYVKYVWGTANTRCDSVSYPIDITCPPTCPTCTIATGLYINSNWVNLSTTTATTVNCNQTVLMNGSITCSNGSTSVGITTVHSLEDNLGNTPSWVNTAQLNVNQLIIPTGINGTFYIKKVWSKNGSKCDSISYPINITCNPCTSSCTPTIIVTGSNPNFILTAPNYSGTVMCGKTYSFNVSLNCTPANSAFAIKQVNVYEAVSLITPSWASSFIASNGTTGLVIPTGITGNYKIKFIWGIQNNLCDSIECSIKINSCPGPCPCSSLSLATPKQAINNGTFQNYTGGTLTVPCGSTNKFYDAPIFPSNCTNVSVIAELKDANNVVVSQPNVGNDFMNPLVYTFSNTNNTSYTLTYTLKSNDIVCKTIVIPIITECTQPPICITCTTKVDTSIKVSLTNNANLSASQLTQSFSFSGLPANITEVRATVTNIKLFAVDEKGVIKEECLSCKNEPRTWASIINGTGITGITPKININGTETNAPVTLAADINSRNISWKNGSIFSINNPLQLTFLLPQKSTLPCCTRKATICVKFVFRNDRCEECIVTKCFDVEIK